uniref:t-SNARE coiled-coil homology domain-containing protein n=1 Tax=Syphacia muris TaxID=451379 RepID=A0A0N5AXJ4_9BILA
MAVFRKPKSKKNLRQKSSVEDEFSEDDNLQTSIKLEAVKELQESRVRHNGLNALECALGKELAAEFSAMDDDPFRQRGGGMLCLSEGRQAQMQAANIEAGIRDQFKKETFLRDENEEMYGSLALCVSAKRKYVQAELRKRKADVDVNDDDTPSNKVQSVEDKLLYKAAEKVRLFRSERNDELLSNQMLAGIPEVDLGVNARMSNIIETEKKKTEMLKEVIEKKKNINEDTLFQQDRAKDLSKNYVQHSIFYMESTTKLGQEDWRKKLDRGVDEARLTLADADLSRGEASIHKL